MFVADGSAVTRVEMFDEHEWSAAIARAGEVARDGT